MDDQTPVQDAIDEGPATTTEVSHSADLIVAAGPGIDEDAGQIDEYQLSSSPNDFNVLTMTSFVEGGAIKIPGFQRQYVWDLKRASKLIESLIIGLPIPQIFLYEQDQNRFLVIDGQQRLLSLYFFVKQRFPRKKWRSEMRTVFNIEGRIPDDDLMNDELFQNFNLSLPKLPNGDKNKFHGLNYSTLGDYRNSFDLRTIRNVIVRQIKPSDDDSSIYEMFNRLNTGGMNLRPQEIRASMYHSQFYDLLFELNARPEWRRILGSKDPDIHMTDVQVLLRALAMYALGDGYKPSMAGFLNLFSKKMKDADSPEVERMRQALELFFSASKELDPALFRSRSGFSVLTFESVFVAAVEKAQMGNKSRMISADSVRDLRADEDYKEFTAEKTGNARNVKGRLARARAIVELV